MKIYIFQNGGFVLCVVFGVILNILQQSCFVMIRECGHGGKRKHQTHLSKRLVSFDDLRSWNRNFSL